MVAITGPKPATLTGLAVGDALGAPFEMKRRNSAELLAWDGWFRGWKSWETRDQFPAGETTDDTAMATILAESLLRNGTYAPADVAQSYLSWYQSEAFSSKGAGSTIKKALSRLSLSLPWTQSGIPGAEGNGSAMRAAPIGLLFWRNVQAAMEMARIDASITHKSESAELGSMVVALAVALLLEGRCPKEYLIHKVVDWVPTSSQMHYRLKAAMVRNTDQAKTLEKVSSLGTSGHVLQTVPAAFCCFVGTDSFKAAVETAVRAGGDTDTVAAITGALAGTYYGIEQVARYAHQVDPTGRLRDLESQLIAASKPVMRV